MKGAYDATFKKAQIDEIQYDYGIVYLDFSETEEKELGLFNGGAKIVITPNGHYLEFDGSGGKEKGTFIVDSVDAAFEGNIKNVSHDVLAAKLPFATYDDVGKILTVGRSNLGLVEGTKHFKNITIFGKTPAGKYKKTTIYNPADFSGLEMEFKPKGEGEFAMKLEGHMDGTLEEAADNLVKIEEVDSIVVV